MFCKRHRETNLSFWLKGLREYSTSRATIFERHEALFLLNQNHRSQYLSSVQRMVHVHRSGEVGFLPAEFRRRSFDCIAVSILCLEKHSCMHIFSTLFIRIVWIFLVIELVCEVFVRPDGYHSLIVSEKAYAPSTVRYINSFHLFIESLSLALFIPEFLCLWTSAYTCGDRPGFSYFNAVYMSVLGPFRRDAFYGRAYIALLRLRVFGLVRHWKKMWINNTFVSRRWKGGSGGILYGVFMPPPIAPNQTFSKNTDKISGEHKGKENSLINASNIGTALLVTNSHRSLMIL